MTRARILLLLSFLSALVLGTLTWSGAFAAAPAAAAVCGGVSVGPEQQVVSNATRTSLGLAGWADGAFGVLPQGNGNYQFIATAALVGSGVSQQSIAVTSGPLDNPVAGGVRHLAPVTNAPTGYTYVGAGPVYRDPTSGIVLETLHLEKLLPGGGFYSSLHLGRFDPATGVTTYLGPIVTPTLPLATAQAHNWSADLGVSSLTVVGGYLQVYFPDYTTGPTGGFAMMSLAAARAPLADVVAAAANGTVVPWSKYDQGAWTSPGLGGASSDLRAGESGAWHPDVVRSAAGGVVMVTMASQTEMRIETSPDGVTGWSGAVPIFRDPTHFDAYPTIVGLGADPSVVGNQFYVYYLQWANLDQSWTDARIMRRLVTCTAGLAPSTQTLIRYDGPSHHIVTTQHVAMAGEYPEYGDVWYLSTVAQPGTHPLYGCLDGAADYFVSTFADCEGPNNAILQTEGWLWDSQPSGVSSVALYRCYQPSAGDHFVSTSAGCEGARDEGQIGWALSTTKVAFPRYWGGQTHWATSGPVSAGYTGEGTWFLEGSAQPGTVPLYGCQYPVPDGVDHFDSLASNCEGTTFLRQEGWIHTSNPDGSLTALYRCYWPGQYDHFMSTDPKCESVPGGIDEGRLGYVATS